MIKHAPKEIQPYLRHFAQVGNILRKGKEHDIYKCEKCQKALDWMADQVRKNICVGCGEPLTRIGEYEWVCKNCHPNLIISKG